MNLYLYVILKFFVITLYVIVSFFSDIRNFEFVATRTMSPTLLKKNQEINIIQKNMPLK